MSSSLPTKLARLAALVAAGALLATLPALGDSKKNNGEGEKADDIDYVALAARMVKDGHYDRAALTLAEVDLDDPNVDLKLFHVLAGLVSLKKKLYSDAARSFEKAVAAGNTNPLVFVNLARAQFGSKDYRGAVAALKRAGTSVEKDPQVALLKSRAHWEAGEPGPALEMLGRATLRFRSDAQFARLEMLYLIKLRLFQELARRRASFLSRPDITAGDLAAIGEALRQGGQLEEAIVSLEAARLRFPDDARLTVLEAHVLLDAGRTLSAAMLLERVAHTEPKYIVEAAELFRRAGRLERALFLNKRIADQKAKIKQRLQILLELERFEMIVGMEARLSRLGLLDDEQIRYAVAFGYFKIGDFDAAERHIARLRDPALFGKGIALRRAMDDCKLGGWQCH